jgi:PAS domain S-box-containing protein
MSAKRNGKNSEKVSRKTYASRQPDVAPRQAKERPAPKHGEDVLKPLNATLEQQVAERTQDLQRSEQQFRRMADHAPVMIWMSGTDKLCTWFNKPWLDFVGNPMEQEVGDGWTRNVHADDYDRCLRTYTAAFEARQPFTMEYRLKRHDGEYRWMLDNGIPLYGTGGDFAGFVGSCIDITRRKELEREVVAIASLQQQRIGQDLHDTVGQELTALELLVGDLAETVRTNPEQASALVARVAEGLRRSQQELRDALRGLFFTSVNAQGLAATLSDLAERIQRYGKVLCTVECPTPVPIANNLTATHLYLIAQEALHNAFKHARAKRIRISLKTTDGGLVVSVQDDGIGMSASPTEHQGLGLRIMRNRAALLGAKLTIAPAQPRGTVVTCVLPRMNDEPRDE